MGPRCLSAPRGGGQRTKKSQAVSKSVYEKITRAQEIMEAGDNEGALKILTALRSSSKLSEYEQQNVLNYLGFVYYNMEDYPRAMRAYEDMLRIPSIEEQMAKTTTFTLAQLNTMEENYTKSISLAAKDKMRPILVISKRCRDFLRHIIQAATVTKCIDFRSSVQWKIS